MKLKKLRYILDALLMILMIVLMGYQITGNFWHEVIGVILVVLFWGHNILNWKWFKNLPQIIKQGFKNPTVVIWTVTNLLLLVDMIVLAVTSVIISRSVFSGLVINGGHIWVYIHTISAYAGFILSSIHLGCHWKVILIQIMKAFGIAKDNQAFTWVTRGLALVLAILGVVASFQRGIASKFIYKSGAGKGAAGNYNPGDSNTNHGGYGNRDRNGYHQGNHYDHDEISSTTGNTTSTTSMSFHDNSDRTFNETIKDGETLNDFLGKLTCTGCGRQCSLLSPQCGTGNSQANSATAYYNQQAGNTNSTPPAGKIKIHADDSLVSLFTDYIPISGMYVCGTYYALELIQKAKKKKKGEEEED